MKRVKRDLTVLGRLALITASLIVPISTYAQEVTPQPNIILPSSFMELDDETQIAMFHYSSKTEDGYRKAFKILNTKLEREHHTLAKYLLGVMYYNGYGVEQDKEEALTNFIQISDENPDAAYLAGFMFIHGDGVIPDVEQGMEFMMLAADSGQVDAQYELAKLNLEQSRTEERPELKLAQEKAAYHYSKLGSMQKNTKCMLILAAIFQDGLAGVPQSQEAAARLKDMVEKLTKNNS